jgi:hypothetical protein
VARRGYLLCMVCLDSPVTEAAHFHVVNFQNVGRSIAVLYQHTVDTSAGLMGAVVYSATSCMSPAKPPL